MKKHLYKVFTAAFTGVACIIWIGTTADAAPDAASIFAAAEKFTVKVRSKIEYPHFEDRKGVFLGAGFIVDRERGWIATNAHVIGRNPSEIKIRFKGGDYLLAKPVYIDEFIDFAVIGIAPDKLPTYATSAKIDCGEPPAAGSAVGAFGHPHNLDYSGTRGIVSGRQYKWHMDWVQTDAAINAGNSGGALIDLTTGSVVGMNTAGLSGDKSDGIGFAIPSFHFCAVLQRLGKNLDPNPPIIPLELSLDHERETGINVMRVYRDADVRWKLLEGDRIVGIVNPTSKNGTFKKLKMEAALITALRSVDADDATLIVERGKKKINVAVQVKRSELMLDQRYLYFSGATVSKTIFKDDEINNPEGYLLIHDIRDESKAEIAGLKAFDLIRSIDGRHFTSLEALEDYLQTRVSKEITMNVHRRSWSVSSKSTYILKKFEIKEIKLMRAGSSASSTK
jgi:serine protease Do